MFISLRAAAAGKCPFPAAVVAAVIFCLSAGQPARAETQFDHIKTLIEAHRYAEAIAVSEGFSANPEISKLNVAFTKALILKNQGRLAEAAAAMRQILASRPDFARVRQELAHTLYLMGDTKAAIYHFERLSDSTVNTSMRSLYDNFIERSRSIRPWSLSAYASLAPSTNLNNVTDADVVYIGGIPFRPNEKKSSGIGVNYGVNGTYRFDLRNHTALTFGASVSGTRFRKTEFDTTRLEAFGELSHRLTPRLTAAVGLSSEYSLKGGKPYRAAIGPIASLQYSWGRAGVSSVQFSWRGVDYIDIDAFDGAETSLGLRHRYAFDTTSSVLGGLDVTYVAARRDYNTYMKYRVFGKIYKEWTNGIITDLEIGGEISRYAGDFPLTSEHRQDRQVDATIGATFRNLQYRGFAPRLEYSYTRNFSNIDLYDYDRNTVALYLTKKF
ncbi:surface lipoprotein assembly modifier [Rhizobium sp. NRK18]|uniref:surface lipoprotein assembly modifier n=1 Tax=Rhizobium sp. NRK18 TaxID=2964667 RepID=UPI0021C2A2C1|nr:surface lipoprotein assembly modifier [Rhizobium sp. NRK18]MCQ2005710.1 surface lipoprotein assembly modifier [Rhizobium sp. NRK18]